MAIYTVLLNCLLHSESALANLPALLNITDTSPIEKGNIIDMETGMGTKTETEISGIGEKGE